MPARTATKSQSTTKSSFPNVKHPVIHSKPTPILRSKEEKYGPVSVQEAQDLLGWEVQPEGEDWGNSFALKDVFGRKVRLHNNPTNRPLKLPIAKRYSSEFLRGEWSLNLETIVFGKSGHIRDGQHRLVGFVLAEQERSINERKWGSEPLELEVLLGFGVSDDKAVADSYDKGQSRSLEDVIYRHEDFSSKLSDKDQRKISKTLSVAIRLVWLRSGGKVVSTAPHFPHSEAMNFYDKHPQIMQSVKKIIKWDDGEGGERLISSVLSLGYAAGLHYLMSKVDKEQADNFFGSLATGENLTKGSPVLALKSFLTNAKAGTGLQRDAIVGACVKAWLAFLEGKTLTTKGVALKRKKDGDKFIFAENPRIGMLDVVVEAAETLSTKERIVLTTLSKIPEEVTYEDLADSVEMSKGAVTKIITNGFLDNKWVKVNQYEPEEGQRKAPYYVQITAKGRSQVC